MIDFGTSDPDVMDILRRGLHIIDENVAPMRDELDRAWEPMALESEIYRLTSSMPKGPLDIGSAIYVSVTTAHECLSQISYIVQNSVPSSPIVLQTLLRAALVGAARTVFVLLPTDPVVRRKRASAVLARDCESGHQGAKRFAEFEGMAAFAAPESFVTKLAEQRKALWPKGNPPGEGKFVEGMTDSLLEALELAGLTEEFGEDELTDHSTWLWNTYSGLAHGYMWPRLLPSIAEDRRIPGDFPLDLHQVATVTHMAFLAVLNRLENGSSNTNDPVPTD